MLTGIWQSSRVVDWLDASRSGEGASSFRDRVRPAKAGMFSGSQSHRGKSQSPVTWITPVEETNLVKLIDKAILGMVSESSGRNKSEPMGGLVRKPKSWRPSSLVPSEGNMSDRNLAEAIGHSSGVVGAAR